MIADDATAVVGLQSLWLAIGAAREREEEVRAAPQLVRKIPPAVKLVSEKTSSNEHGAGIKGSPAPHVRRQRRMVSWICDVSEMFDGAA